MTEVLKKARGFAATSPERRREIAQMGGKAAHVKGTAHTWDSEAARKAGRKGGLALAENRDQSRFVRQTGFKRLQQESVT